MINPDDFFKDFIHSVINRKFKSTKNGKPVPFRSLRDRNNSLWTKWIEDLMQNMAKHNNLLCFNYSADRNVVETKEIMKIDHTFTIDTEDWYLKAYPLIAVEHENSYGKKYEALKWSLWKLLHFNANLKVLIGYPDARRIEEILKFFEAMIIQRKKQLNITQSMLVVFGLKENDRWIYYGFKLVNNKFKRILQ